MTSGQKSAYTKQQMAKANIGAKISYFPNDKIITLSALASLVFTLISLGLILITFSHLPPEVPLFYSAKTQILGRKILIFALPGIIFITFLINFLISRFILSKWPFLSQVLAATAAIVGFLVLWAQLEISLLF